MRNKTNVLFISHDSSLQGAERCLIDLVSNLDRKLFDPYVILPWKGPIEDHLLQACIPYKILHLTRWIPSHKNASWHYIFRFIRDLRAHLWALLSLIEKENINLVYTNTSTVLEGALVARRAGIPHIWHIHEYLSANPDIYSYLPNRLTDRIITKLSDCIITPSQSLAKKRFDGSNKAYIVNNGVNLNAFQLSDGTHIKRELNIPGDAAIITFIGSIAATKDPLTFIRAAAQIIAAKPNTHFLVAGHASDTSLNNSIKEFIKSTGLSSNIHLLGFRKDTHDILSAATIHVSTSQQETFGLTIVEAMACRKPVVVTRCGGPEEVVINSKTGLVVEAGNFNAVANAIFFLIDNPTKATEMGQAGEKRAQERFSVQTYVNKISNLIEETCHEHS